VSAHYVIARDGTVYQLVDERARAWHAGDSLWGGMTDLNSASLGIELDNNGAEPFPDVQISALLALLTDLQQRYRIPARNFLGHADIAPKRKGDPSPYFPWQLLAQRL
jgi:N-acetylmuramoyl-L-alanine amidase